MTVQIWTAARDLAVVSAVSVQLRIPRQACTASALSFPSDDSSA